MDKITFIDFFAGIGGFRLGLESAGFKCIGFCENDKFAIKSYRNMYNTEGEWFSDDISKLKSEDIPNADIWTFGFPCQDISVAGRRTGLEGNRSSLYYKVIEKIKGKKEEDKPRWLIAENVKNLLSINGGWDFARVLTAMDEAGYDIEWQLFNSKDYGVPQNRERIYIIGHLRTKPSRQILPIQRKNSAALKQIIGGKQGYRTYDISGISCTLTSNGGGLGVKTGLYLETYPIQSPNRINKKQNGRRMKKTNESMFTITSQDRHGVGIKDKNEFRIRRLTPRECFRLQGFPDEYFDKAQEVNSDNQLYKQAGNAVTVNVVYKIGRGIYKDIKNEI